MKNQYGHEMVTLSFGHYSFWAVTKRRKVVKNLNRLKTLKPLILQA